MSKIGNETDTEYNNCVSVVLINNQYLCTKILCTLKLTGHI